MHYYSLANRTQIRAWVKSKVDYVFILIFSTFFFATNSFFGYDQIHEGVSVSSILANDSGLFPHRDFHESKGALYPFIISFLTSSSILQIKLVNAMFSTLSTLLFYAIGKSYEKRVAFGFSLLWVCSSPLFGNFSYKSELGIFMIQPNHLFVMVVLMSIFLLRKAIAVEVSHSSGLFLIAGILCGALPWIRVQGLVFSFSCLLVVLFFAKKGLWARKSQILIFATGLMSALSFPLILFYLNGALSSWTKDIVLLNLERFQSGDTAVTMSGQDLLKTLGVFLLVTSLQLLLWLVVGLLCLSVWSTVLLTFSLSALFYFFVSQVVNTPIDITKNLDVQNWFLILAGQFPMWPWRTVVVVTLLFPIILLIVKKITFRELLDGKFASAFVFLGAASCATLLWPNIGNLWDVALPICLGFMVLMRHMGHSYSSAITSGITAHAVALLVLTIFRMILFPINDPSLYKYPNGIMKGIYDVSESRVSEVTGLLSTLSTTSGLITNKCPFGILVAPNGKYRSFSIYPSTIGAGKVLLKESRGLGAEVIVECDIHNVDYHKDFEIIRVFKIDGLTTTVLAKN